MDKIKKKIAEAKMMLIFPPVNITSEYIEVHQTTFKNLSKQEILLENWHYTFQQLLNRRREGSSTSQLG
jgi:hypothetical protein